ncbi:MAG TPA: HEPN domain-containing protein [Solirubrobacterales bacterium]|nr:HEPN domain-containing protein [Solirubrobacterales bacterium]
MPDAGDLAKVLARKATGDARVARKLAPDPEIDDEAIGFHAQQAVEKWLKAVMAFHGLEEARIHDLGRLLEILDSAGIDPPPGADQLDDLSIYAVPLRYADLLDAEPLDREATVALFNEVGEWAEAQLAK